MTIHLITGMPGAGKTLRTLQDVKLLSEKDDRQVFYSGITDLKLPWVEIEPEKWPECPKGAIIVIDECQRVFRTRASGSAVPKHVSELETHRHKGHDIFLITQHPMLIDGNVRRLVGKHFHVMRPFGLKKATVHEFQGVRENCDKSRKDSIKHMWAYPKEIYDYYKSAELHTVKRSIPAKILFIPVLIGLLIFCIYYSYNIIAGKKKIEAANAAASAPVEYRSTNSPGLPSTSKDHLTREQWIEQQTPRIPTLAYTAPVYDKLTEPVSVPAPQVCMQTASKGCKCYTNQATPLDVPQSMCENIVKNGVFIPFLQNGNQSNENSLRNET
ncbi:Zonular occludens toxin [Iodobacter sp. HSC-16F04]|uniref:Zonular occludens toxin n=1 Tax=Iodobacter violaceini TaxID=3044271 RepID=A0ABX0KT72_9NEIS|nr:zonular occludens toxin domain-containing protein [Iodobacter violacea]NHQ85294.1 Zonular occludens toxin [Iodobacter violacea]